MGLSQSAILNCVSRLIVVVNRLDGAILSSHKLSKEVMRFPSCGGIELRNMMSETLNSIKLDNANIPGNTPVLEVRRL